MDILMLLIKVESRFLLFMLGLPTWRSHQNQIYQHRRSLFLIFVVWFLKVHLMELLFKLLLGFFIVVCSRPKLRHTMWWLLLTPIRLAFAPPLIRPQNLWLAPFPVSCPIPLARFHHPFPLLILSPLPPLHIDAVESPPLPRHPLLARLIILIHVSWLRCGGRWCNFAEWIWKIDLPHLSSGQHPPISVNLPLIILHQSSN